MGVIFIYIFLLFLRNTVMNVRGFMLEINTVLHVHCTSSFFQFAHLSSSILPNTVLKFELCIESRNFAASCTWATSSSAMTSTPEIITSGSGSTLKSPTRSKASTTGENLSYKQGHRGATGSWGSRPQYRFKHDTSEKLKYEIMESAS